METDTVSFGESSSETQTESMLAGSGVEMQPEAGILSTQVSENTLLVEGVPIDLDGVKFEVHLKKVLSSAALVHKIEDFPTYPEILMEISRARLRSLEQTYYVVVTFENSLVRNFLAELLTSDSVGSKTMCRYKQNNQQYVLSTRNAPLKNIKSQEKQRSRSLLRDLSVRDVSPTHEARTASPDLASHKVPRKVKPRVAEGVTPDRLSRFGESTGSDVPIVSRPRSESTPVKGLPGILRMPGAPTTRSKSRVRVQTPQDSSRVEDDSQYMKSVRATLGEKARRKVISEENKLQQNAVESIQSLDSEDPTGIDGRVHDYSKSKKELLILVREDYVWITRWVDMVRGLLISVPHSVSGDMGEIERWPEFSSLQKGVNQRMERYRKENDDRVVQLNTDIDIPITETEIAAFRIVDATQNALVTTLFEIRTILKDERKKVDHMQQEELQSARKERAQELEKARVERMIFERSEEIEEHRINLDRSRVETAVFEGEKAKLSQELRLKEMLQANVIKSGFETVQALIELLPKNDRIKEVTDVHLIERYRERYETVQASLSGLRDKAVLLHGKPGKELSQMAMALEVGLDPNMILIEDRLAVLNKRVSPGGETSGLNHTTGSSKPVGQFVISLQKKVAFDSQALIRMCEAYFPTSNNTVQQLAQIRTSIKNEIDSRRTSMGKVYHNYLDKADVFVSLINENPGDYSTCERANAHWNTEVHYENGEKVYSEWNSALMSVVVSSEADFKDQSAALLSSLEIKRFAGMESKENVYLFIMKFMERYSSLAKTENLATLLYEKGLAENIRRKYLSVRTDFNEMVKRLKTEYGNPLLIVQGEKLAILAIPKPKPNSTGLAIVSYLESLLGRLEQLEVLIRKFSDLDGDKPEVIVHISPEDLKAAIYSDQFIQFVKTALPEPLQSKARLKLANWRSKKGTLGGFPNFEDELKEVIRYLSNECEVQRNLIRETIVANGGNAKAAPTIMMSTDAWGGQGQARDQNANLEPEDDPEPDGSGRGRGRGRGRGNRGRRRSKSGNRGKGSRARGDLMNIGDTSPKPFGSPKKVTFGADAKQKDGVSGYRKEKKPGEMMDLEVAGRRVYDSSHLPSEPVCLAKHNGPTWKRPHYWAECHILMRLKPFARFELVKESMVCFCCLAKKCSPGARSGECVNESKVLTCNSCTALVRSGNTAWKKPFNVLLCVKHRGEFDLQEFLRKFPASFCGKGFDSEKQWEKKSISEWLSESMTYTLISPEMFSNCYETQEYPENADLQSEGENIVNLGGIDPQISSSQGFFHADERKRSVQQARCAPKTRVFDAYTGKAFIQETIVTETHMIRDNLEDVCFIFQVWNLGGIELLVFFDCGANNHAIKLLKAKSCHWSCIDDRKGYINAAGDTRVMVEGLWRAVVGYDVDGNTYEIVATGMSQITSEFVRYSLVPLHDDVISYDVKNGHKIGPSDKLPLNVGGHDVGLLVGLKATKMQPLLLHSLPSGLLVYKMCMKDVNGSRIAFGGPHSIFSKQNSDRFGCVSAVHLMSIQQIQDCYNQEYVAFRDGVSGYSKSFTVWDREGRRDDNSGVNILCLKNENQFLPEQVRRVDSLYDSQPSDLCGTTIDSIAVPELSQNSALKVLAEDVEDLNKNSLEKIHVHSFTQEKMVFGSPSDKREANGNIKSSEDCCNLVGDFSSRSKIQMSSLFDKTEDKDANICNIGPGLKLPQQQLSMFGICSKDSSSPAIEQLSGNSIELELPQQQLLMPSICSKDSSGSVYILPSLTITEMTSVESLEDFKAIQEGQKLNEDTFSLVKSSKMSQLELSRQIVPATKINGRCEELLKSDKALFYRKKLLGTPELGFERVCLKFVCKQLEDFGCFSAIAECFLESAENKWRLLLVRVNHVTSDQTMKMESGHVIELARKIKKKSAESPTDLEILRLKMNEVFFVLKKCSQLRIFKMKWTSSNMFEFFCCSEFELLKVSFIELLRVQFCWRSGMFVRLSRLSGTRVSPDLGSEFAWQKNFERLRVVQECFQGLPLTELLVMENSTGFLKRVAVKSLKEEKWAKKCTEHSLSVLFELWTRLTCSQKFTII